MKINQRKIHIDSFEEYETSILRYLEDWLKTYYGNLEEIKVENIKDDLKKINAYPNLSELEKINDYDIVVLDDDKNDFDYVEKQIIEGKIFWEHAAAGEATRLGLGTKYLLNLKNFSIEEITGLMISEEIKDLGKKGLSLSNYNKEITKIYEKINMKKVTKAIGNNPSKLLDISLGNRHMLQMTFDIVKLAKKYNLNPKEILSKQSTLIVVNEKAAEKIIKDFIEYKFFGLDSNNVYFMIQKSFHGIYLKEGNLFFDKNTITNKRLHNHGQLMLQKGHDEVIFKILPENNQKIYLKNYEFENLLSNHHNMLSYNIEDINYLTSSIDFASLDLALDLGRQGYEMVMEIVKNNPIKPQKGGACFFDKKLQRTIMIESDKLMGLRPDEIIHLNKNFNHYPNPVKAFQAMKKHGFPMTLEVKTCPNKNQELKNYIYVCPPQGDFNFLLKTAYVSRKNIKPIANWKSPATTPATLREMFKQDNQIGFKEYAWKMKRKIISENLNLNKKYV